MTDRPNETESLVARKRRERQEKQDTSASIPTEDQLQNQSFTGSPAFKGVPFTNQPINEVIAENESLVARKRRERQGGLQSGGLQNIDVKPFTYTTVQPVNPQYNAARVFSKIVMGDGVNLRATQKILARLDMLASLPEVADRMSGQDLFPEVSGNIPSLAPTEQQVAEKVRAADDDTRAFLEQFGLTESSQIQGAIDLLANPAWLNVFADQFWTNFMDASLSAYKKDPKIVASASSVMDDKFIAEWFSSTGGGSRLDEESRKLMFWITASVPTDEELIADAGVSKKDFGSWPGSGMLETINYNFDWLRAAPEAIRPYVQSPRSQIIALSEVWLRNKDINDPETKVDFFNYVFSLANKSISDIERIKESKFFGLAESTVGLIPTVGFDAFNDATQIGANVFQNAIGNAGDPTSIKQQLSVGQSTALSAGVDPTNPMFNDVSGFVDGFVQIYLDPQNLLFGFGAARKFSKLYAVPNGTTTRQLIKASLNPFSKENIGLVPTHVMDRGLAGRIFFSVLAKEQEDIYKLPKNIATWNRIGRMTSKSAIAERYPNLANALSLPALASAKNGEEVLNVVRYASRGDEMFAEPVMKLFKDALKKDGTMERLYRKARLLKTSEKDFNLADLGVADGIDPQDVYTLFDEANEGVSSVRDFERGARTAKGGDETIVTISGKDYNFLVKDDNLALVDAAGETVSFITKGLSDVPQIATAVTARNQGLMSFLLDQAGEGVRAKIAAAHDLSGGAARLVGAPQIQVLTPAKLAQDGTRKTVLSSVRSNAVRLEISNADELEKATKWIDEFADSDFSVKLAAGERLSDMTQAELDNLMKYMQAEGADILKLGDESMMSTTSRLESIRGVDGPINPEANMSKALPNEYFNMVESRIGFEMFNKENAGDLWIIKDIPSNKMSQGLWDFGKWAGDKLPDKIVRKMRRGGFVLKHKYPSGIDYVNGVSGSQELRNWMKFFGGSDELANRVGDKFMNANMVSRRDVMREAFIEVADEIDFLPMKLELINLAQRESAEMYSFGRSGLEISLTHGDDVVPQTLSHMAKKFNMIDAADAKKSLKRWNGPNKRMPSSVHRGIKMTGTQARRGKIIKELKERLKRSGIDASDLNDQDFARLAYSDVVAGPGNRGTGAGMVNKVAMAPVKFAKGFNSVFTQAQLVGRPIPWNSRILIEESFRASLMGGVSMWSFPYEYIGRYADARAIRQLPKRIQDSSVLTKRFIDDIWGNGRDIDLPRLKAVFPDIAIDDSWTKADITELVSREFRGGLVTTEGRVGLRSGAVTQAFKNNRRITSHRSRIAKYESIDETFDWRVDGVGIANRTFHAGFMEEANAAAMPVVWSPVGMSPKDLENFGMAYARAGGQMLDDAMVGFYGIKRMRARLLGQNPDMAVSAAELSTKASFDQVETLIDRTLRTSTEVDVSVMTKVQKAQWYLDNVIDEISETLYRPLIQQMEAGPAAEALANLKNGSAEIVLGGETIVLNRSSYESFVVSMREVAQVAYDNGIPMPKRIAAYVEPSFGQRPKPANLAERARRIKDGTMRIFGENTSQYLNRQPTYLQMRERFFQMYKGFGWDDDIAKAVAGERATEITNYIFFDNSEIPQFLKAMNSYIPFFSAMWEVGQTWAYKIPLMNNYGLGLAHLTRRVDRTLQGLIRSGVASYDTQTGQMSITAANDPDRGSVFANAVSKFMFETARAPIVFGEYMTGLLSLVKEGGFESADFSALTKDGFTVGIGNPLDPGTFGIMAINQISAGFTPTAQYLASRGAKRLYAWDDIVTQPKEVDLREYADNNLGVDIGSLLYYNKDSFIDANGKDNYNKALSQKIDVLDLKMPINLRQPKTSWWETMLDSIVFPFGKIDTLGETFGTVVPSALAYVVRAAFARNGDSGDWLGYVLGNMSNYQVGAEKIVQLQMLEAGEGLMTKELNLAGAILKYQEDKKLSIFTSPTGDVIVKGDSDESAILQAMYTESVRLNSEIVRRMNNGAAGSLFTRGLYGNLGPSTPRMYTEEQEAIKRYWAGRNFAEEVNKTDGAPDLRGTIADSASSSLQDMAALTGIIDRWLTDPTGDSAKRWILENNPELAPFAQGKSYYGELGFHPDQTGFDRWVADVEAGILKAPSPALFTQRQNRTGIGADKQLAIVEKYGNELGPATQVILGNWDEWQQFSDIYNAKYDALNWLDTFLYDNALGNYNSKSPDTLTEVDFLNESVWEAQRAADAMMDILQYSDMKPKEMRSVAGQLNSTIAEYGNKVRAMTEFDPEYQNPLEQNIGEYFDKVSGPYYTERSNLYKDFISTADNQTDRSAGFELIRDLDNKTYQTAFFIESSNGETLAVPDPLTRSWNGQEDSIRQERIFYNLSKRGAWLNIFDIDVIMQEYPQAAQFLPNAESAPIYKKAAEDKRKIAARASANFETITPGARTKDFDKVDEETNLALRRIGRTGELDYDKAMPIQRLGMLGALPKTLKPVLSAVNQVVAALRAADKTPQSNLGRIQFLRLVNEWMVPVFFRDNPQARDDLFQLGEMMYDTDQLDVITARFFQGALPRIPRLE